MNGPSARRRIASSVALALAAAGCGSRPEHAQMKGADTASLAGAVPDPNVVTSRSDGTVASPSHDWGTVRARDTLRVVAPFNSTTYFIYRGLPLGYEYELLKRFAEEKKLKLKWTVVQNRDSLFRMLTDGRADIVAARLIPMPEDSTRALFTHALYHTDPVLVQRKGPPGQAGARLPDPTDTVLKPGPAERGPKPVSVPARLVLSPADLKGQRVTLPEESPYVPTLLELEDEISGDITVVEVDKSAETLVREIAKGNIAYTVVDGNVAKLQGAQFKNLMVQPVLGASKKVAWAVRRDSRELLDTLNAWIDDEQSGPVFAQLYKKYYIDQRAYLQRATSPYFSSRTGTLSPYDSLLRLHAPKLGWDWRLLGSQMFQESRFDPKARSWVGATGLMQLMPATARQFGVRSITNPAQNVEGGVKFLVWLDKFWTKRLDDPAERLKFMLASYNAGAGHVEDAQRLAEKHGDDPKKWASVSYWMLQLSKQEYYADPVVRFGFCRGLEPVSYVSIILDRFQHYKQFVSPDVAAVLDRYRPYVEAERRAAGE
jgi:membrane-bound lytic murein transglycosylase F